MNENNNWKTKSYIVGLTSGTLFGLLSAYLFNRATEEEMERTGSKQIKLQTGQMIGLGLAAMAMARQIAEMGKPKK